MTWNSYVYLICCRIQTERGHWGQQQLSFFVSRNVHQVALKVHISLLSRYANVIVVAWNFKKFEILHIAVSADVVLIRVKCTYTYSFLQQYMYQSKIYFNQLLSNF